MWDNPRLLNMAAGALVGVAALAFTIAGAWLLLRSESFPVREIEVKTAIQKTSKEEIKAVLSDRIRGNFFAVSPAEVRVALERLPWVRGASVRRVWPDRLEVALEEHVAFARWSDQSLVNSYGERFFAKTDQLLPQLVGPAGTERELAHRYRRFAEILTPLGAPLERVVLTPRFAWELRLGSGLNIMLGRDADTAETRLQRFAEVYDGTLRKMQRKHDYVDLRYPNGFALRVPELKGS